LAVAVGEGVSGRLVVSLGAVVDDEVVAVAGLVVFLEEVFSLVIVCPVRL
jgi:hypothetical protein